MIHSTLFADRVQMAFQPTPRGVVGLVDDLLGLCRLYQLRINFGDGHCSVRRLRADAQESLNVPVPKSVFRAALARIAAICNEQRTLTTRTGVPIPLLARIAAICNEERPR